MPNTPTLFIKKAGLSALLVLLPVVINTSIIKIMESGMGDPGSYLSAKLASMVGGFFGGAAILTFIRPKSVGEAFVRGSVSTGSAIIFAVPLLEYLSVTNTWENQLMSGFVVGFLSYSVLGMIANFLKRYQHKDLVELYKDIKK